MSMRDGADLPEPMAWAAGTECNARGFIDVMAWSEGEFTVPLYTADQLRTAIAAERELRIAAEERQALYIALTRDAQDIAAKAQDDLFALTEAIAKATGATA